jgi:hypothetical protein
MSFLGDGFNFFGWREGGMLMKIKEQESDMIIYFSLDVISSKLFLQKMTQHFFCKL